MIPVYALKFSLNDQYKEMLLARRGMLAVPGDEPALTVLDRIAAGVCPPVPAFSLPCADSETAKALSLRIRA